MSSTNRAEAQKAQLEAEELLAKELEELSTGEVPDGVESSDDEDSVNEVGSYSSENQENPLEGENWMILDLEDEKSLRKDIFNDKKPSVLVLTRTVFRIMRKQNEKAEQLESEMQRRIASLEKEVVALRNLNVHLEKGVEKAMSDLEEERQISTGLNDRLTAQHKVNVLLVERMKAGGKAVPGVEQSLPKLSSNGKVHEIYESFDELTKDEVEELINHLADVPADGESVWSKWKLNDHDSKKLLKVLKKDDFISKYPTSLKESHNLSEGLKFEIVIHALKLGFFNFAEFDHLKKLINSIFKCKPLINLKDYSGALAYLRRNYLMLTMRPRSVSALEPFFLRMRSLLPNLPEERKAKMAIKQLWPSPLKAFLLSKGKAMIAVDDDETTIWESIEKNIAKWTKDYSHADRQKFIKTYFKDDAQLRTEMEKKLMDQENQSNEKLQRERDLAERTARIEQARLEAEAKRAADEKARAEAKTSATAAAASTTTTAVKSTGKKKKKKNWKKSGGGDPPAPGTSGTSGTSVVSGGPAKKPTDVPHPSSF